MFFSDEPGYYEDGNFGIRLETILRVVSMNLTDTTYGKSAENYGVHQGEDDVLLAWDGILWAVECHVYDHKDC